MSKRTKCIRHIHDNKLWSNSTVRNLTQFVDVDGRRYSSLAHIINSTTQIMMFDAIQFRQLKANFASIARSQWLFMRPQYRHLSLLIQAWSTRQSPTTRRINISRDSVKPSGRRLANDMMTLSPIAHPWQMGDWHVKVTIRDGWPGLTRWTRLYFRRSSPTFPDVILAGLNDY